MLFSYKKQRGSDFVRLLGRTKIFSDEKEITKENVVDVLRKAYAKHKKNVVEMQFLIDYEIGVQPLPFQKIVRPEINIETIDNMANYVTEFKKGYFWGNPAVYTQRGSKEHHNTDANIDSSGISALNEMMLNGVCIGKENQILADFVEKVGVGYRLVDAKTDWENRDEQSSYANIYTLDPRNTFCVYHNGVGSKKILSATFVKAGNKLSFTVFTDDARYEISGWKVIEDNPNPFGRNPIVEYERAVDRTGCFERQISIMDNLNSLVSNFANDVAQKTQEIWWANDVNFPTDKITGEVIKPKSGEWAMTYSGEGAKPSIQPLGSTFDSAPTLNAIRDTRNEILKKCFVPMQYSSEGGGSTGTATDTMSGWNATAVDANRQEQLISSSDREELILILKAVSLAPSSVLPLNDPLRKIHSSDIDIHYSRQKNYDLNSKMNATATAVKIGINGRHALKLGDAWDDIEQVWLDSKDSIEAYQKSIYEKPLSDATDRIMQDSSDQVDNSPSVDDMKINSNS